MRVYIITEGTYSDYHIVGVVEDRELAEKYVNIHETLHTDYNIEEYSTDEISIESLKEDYDYKVKQGTVSGWIFQFECNGKLIDDGKYINLTQQDLEIPFRQEWSSSEDQYVDIVAVRGYNSPADRDRCLKAARDKRAEYLANKYGLNL